MPIVDFPNRGPLFLPEPFNEFRPHQIDAIEEILTEFESGTKMVLLDAPTGAGKTIIGEAVRILHGSNRALYMCTTKGLQDQFLHDFPHAHLIKGRSNYPTWDLPEAFSLGIDGSVCTYHRTSDRYSCKGCEKEVPDLRLLDEGRSRDENPTFGHCDYCHPNQYCPYKVTKTNALNAKLAVANTAYFLGEANNVGGFSNLPLLIVDEADTIESLIMSFMEVGISRQRMKQIGLQPPPKKTVALSWVVWLADSILLVENKTQDLQGTIRRLQRDLNDVVDKRAKTEIMKQIASLSKQKEATDRIWGTMVRLQSLLTKNPDNWVYDDQGGGVYFRPVEVAEFGQPLLFGHAKNILMMSATLISPATMVSFLGFEDRWATVTVDSNFPVERRPVYVAPAANMTYKSKEAEWPKMIEAVAAILERHADVKILVHTVSYEFTSMLFNALLPRFGQRLYTYRDSREREHALGEYRDSHNGVMIAPSFDRGVDLPNDDARVIVVTKVPFPSLGDKQVAQRLHGTGLPGRTWYAMETVRSLVQMTGRGMRHKDDWCISYILDRQFSSNVWKSQSRLIPKWWSKALVWGPPTNGGREAVERTPVPMTLEHV